MVDKARSRQPRAESLPRDRVIEAAIALLHRCGKGDLTFRALAERFTTNLTTPTSLPSSRASMSCVAQAPRSACAASPAERST